MTNDLAGTLKGQRGKGGGGIGPEETLVVAPLSHGSNPNSNAAGRRREDDENLVVSDTLDGYNGWNADAAEANPGALLRRVREALGEEALCEWGLGIAPALREEAVLRSRLYEGRLPGETDVAIAVKQQSGGCTSPLARRAVLTLRRHGERGCSPSRRKSVQQLARELRAALSELPHSGAQASWLVLGLREASEGLGVLREALPAVQAVGRPLDREDEPAHAAASVRRLTPREAERLQGLPDDWTKLDEKTPDSRRYAGLGDAVTANVAEWLGRRLLAA